MAMPNKSAYDFTIITSVFNPDRKALERCIRSVKKQSYSRWNWLIVDDCSTQPWVSKFLAKVARRNKRIRIVRRDSYGGSARSINSAMPLVTGDYIAFLEPMVELDRDALAAINHELFIDHSFDLLYADEDTVTAGGLYERLIRKPDWSPERLLCHDYLGNFRIVRTESVRKAGSLDHSHERAHLHDLILKISDSPIRVRHVARTLAHTIHQDRSEDELRDELRDLAASTHRVLTETCRRRGLKAEVVPAGHGFFRIKRELTSTPRVSLIIPTRGTVGSVWGLEMPFVENFLLSSIAKTSYPDVEYVIVVDSNTDPELLERMRNMKANIKLVEFSGRFNFSKKCNLGAVNSSGERLIFVNDDVEVITPDWIESLIVFLEDPSIGASGPLLLYDNGLVQSGGHVNTGPRNFASGMSPDASFWGQRHLIVNRESTGVTGACLAIRRSSFFEVGGFSEIFPESYNDVDLCFKLLALEKRIIWTPEARLHHFELKSRPRHVDPFENEVLSRYWGRWAGPERRDPFIDIN